MILITSIILPIYILIILLSSRKINAFESFAKGCKEGMIVVVNIIPYYIAMLFSVNIFVNSNILSDLLRLVKFSLINSDLLLQGIMRPLSGTASLSIMNNIFTNEGVDSITGITSSIIQGSTDTTLFVITLYFGSVGILKSKKAVTLGLIVDLIGFIVSILIVTFIML